MPYSMTTIVAGNKFMSETFQQLLRDIAILVLGSASTFLVQHWRRPQEVKDQHLEKQQGLIERQTKTLDDAWNQIEELLNYRKQDEKDRQALNERIERLEADNRKFRNGYARAIRYIYDKDPLAEIPNFLIDTNPKVQP